MFKHFYHYIQLIMSNMSQTQHAQQQDVMPGNPSHEQKHDKNKPVKIAYFLESIAKVGGLERIFIDKANYLANNYNGKYKIYIITLSQSNNPIIYPISDKIVHQDLDINYYKIYEMSLGHRIFGRLQKSRMLRTRIEEIINKECFDIIDTPFPHIANELSYVKFNGKRIFESHIIKNHLGKNDGTNRAWFKEFAYLKQRRWHIKRINEVFDAVVVLSEDDKKQWHRARNTQIIPNTTFIQANDNVGLHHSRKCVTMGRLVYQKNHELLINAWKRVHQLHPDWKLEIYGEGEEHDKLTSLIKQNDLCNVAQIYPPLNDIRQILADAQIFVLSSRYEGFGLVLIEAMTLGVPCISTNCPAGPADIIQSGVNGLLVENENVGALADGICQLIEDEELQNRLSLAGRDNVKRYAPEFIMNKWANLIDNLTSEV